MAQTNSALTIIGPDSVIKGEMDFASPARILGAFEGRIRSKAEVHLGQGARCRATIEAGSIVIEGVHDGDLVAAERVQLTSTARVAGDITARTLVVTEGASFVGHCRVGGDAPRSRSPELVVKPAGAPKAAAPSAEPADGEEAFARLGSKLTKLARDAAQAAAESE